MSSVIGTTTRNRLDARCIDDTAGIRSMLAHDLRVLEGAAGKPFP